MIAPALPSSAALSAEHAAARPVEEQAGQSAAASLSEHASAFSDSPADSLADFSSLFESESERKGGVSDESAGREDARSIELNSDNSQHRYSLRPPNNRGVPPTPVYVPDDFRRRVLSLGKEQVDVPKSHEEAMAGPHKEEWSNAETGELDVLSRFQTYEVVCEVPPGIKPIKTKWVYARKADGRYKARVVAMGNLQTEGTYFATRADVAAFRSFLLIPSLCSVLGGVHFQGDATSAFLQCGLDEVVYVESPPGTPRQIWRLLRCLYGLKQSGRQWRLAFDRVLRACGFLPSEADPAFYYLRDRAGALQSVLCVHVDDFWAWARSKLIAGEVIKDLGRHIALKIDLTPSLLLHVQVQTAKDSSIVLGQESYIIDVIKAFESVLPGIVPSRVPLQKGVYLLPGAKESDLLSDEYVHYYQALIGALNFIACRSRPDLAFAVQQFSMYMHKPTRLHWSLLSRVLGYLYRTRSSFLRYPAYKSNRKKVRLIGFSDANLPNTPDAKPTMGILWCLEVDGYLCLISWSSRKLTHVVLSTVEAELAAASEAVTEGIALRQMCLEIGLIDAADPVVLYCDNKGACDVAHNGGYYPKLKHVNRRHKFVVQAQAEHKIEVQWCAGQDQLADGLTKALGGPELDVFRAQFFAELTKQDA